MSVLTKAGLTNEATVQLATNGIKRITATILRQMIFDLIDSLVSLEGGHNISAPLGYSSDVSADYTDRSFVDKGYVDTIIGDQYSFIKRSSGPDGHRWKFTIDDTGMISMPGEDLGI